MAAIVLRKFDNIIWHLSPKEFFKKTVNRQTCKLPDSGDNPKGSSDSSGQENGL